MSKSNFQPKAGDLVRQSIALEVSDVVIHQAKADGSFAAGMGDSSFASLGYRPDRWKAYMEFNICYALPSFMGPVAQGFYAGYLPQTLEMSHGSLLHQQMNLNHVLKAYEKEEGKKNPKDDHIVGCVVATLFPKAPIEGWKIGTDPAAAPSIRAMAVIFKLADGVNRVMGDHQTSRKKQSVSIETITPYDNIGIYLPSRGVEGIVPLLGVTEDAILDVLELEPLSIGKVNGEQAVFVFGIGKPVEFRGVGITPRPAEAQAKIVSFDAERKELEAGTLVAMAASQVDQELMGRLIKFRTGRTGEVKKVFTQGKARMRNCKWGIAASAEDPVLEIELPDKRHVLRTVSSLGKALEPAG